MASTAASTTATTMVETLNGAASKSPVGAAVPALPADGVLEADDADHADADSAYGSSSGDSTSSVYSHISRGILQNGRRYQAFREGEYWSPSDEQQFESQSYGHIVMQVLDAAEENPLFRSPIGERAQHVLDVGTGDAIWAIDVADRFPNLTVHGVDLYPPPESWLPPNCILEVDDLTQEWTWSHKFDLVHLRRMLGSFTDAGWAKLYAEIYKNLQPGGWIEQVEPSVENTSDDGSMPKDSLLATWGDAFLEAGKITGRPMDTIHTMKSAIEAAGFVNVHEKLYKSPFGSWPKHPVFKDAGRLNEAQFRSGMEGYALHLLTNVLGWESEAVHVYLANVRAELDNPTWHKYHLVRRVWAQKPYETKGAERATDIEV